MPSPALNTLPIRHLAPADHLACADLSESRGWAREEHKWRLLLTAGAGYAIDDPWRGGLLAACVLTRYGPALPHRRPPESGPAPEPAPTPGPGPGLGAVGMMLVAEEHTRQGVARRLLRHVMAVTAPMPLTLYATPMGRPLYEQLGFKTIGRSEMVRGHFVPDAAGDDEVRAKAAERSPRPGPAGITRPAVAEDLPAVLRLDSEVFGVDRTHMITRLPTFSDVFSVAEVHGRITGYGALWPNGETHVVGPLVAADTPTAVALLASLAARTDRVLRTDVDVRHTGLLTWLKAHGLTTVASNAVMTHGIAELPGDPARNFAPLTVAAG